MSCSAGRAKSARRDAAASRRRCRGVCADADAHLGALGVVAHGVIDEHAADLLHPLFVADAVRQAARRTRQHHPAAVARRQAAELAHEPARGLCQVDRLGAHLDGTRVEPGQVEQVGGELLCEVW